MRAGKLNAGNLAFRLRPPKIDEAGMVAAKPAIQRNTLALPLELELLMLEQQQKEDRQ